jgi:lipopolysaccharide transport system permease protein
MILMYSLVFGKIMTTHGSNIHSEKDYILYLSAGMLSWTLFSEIINNCTNIFVNNSNTIKKLKFPHLCLPITVSISAAINFLATFIIFLIYIMMNIDINIKVYLSLIPILITQILIALSLGLVIGVINVFFRDMGQVTQLILQVWFWLTPVVYNVEMLPERIINIINLNPLTHLLNGYRCVILQNKWPDWSALFQVMVLATLMISISMYIFNKIDSVMIDEL